MQRPGWSSRPNFSHADQFPASLSKQALEVSCGSTQVLITGWLRVSLLVAASGGGIVASTGRGGAYSSSLGSAPRNRRFSMSWEKGRPVILLARAKELGIG